MFLYTVDFACLFLLEKYLTSNILSDSRKYKQAASKLKQMNNQKEAAIKDLKNFSSPVRYLDKVFLPPRLGGLKLMFDT